MLYIKPLIKKVLPRPAWNFLKKCRNIIYMSANKMCSAFIRNAVLSAYKEQILCLPTKDSPDFISFRQEPAAISSACPKTIAFYLPQFHPFPENDLWWGKGFTEWTNVTKAVPQFIGHHQPRLPVDLGFYDLRLPDVMRQQIEMAKHYGLHGFCFHYYWFSGKRLMETPLFNFLENKKLDMPFCLCWANESWSRRWDGSEDELLIEQKLRDEDDVLFMKDIQPFITDKRYITVQNKPLLIIYRPHLWTQSRVLRLLATFRKSAQEMGLPGLYIVCALTHDFQGSPEQWGFDAGIEFPPHLCGHVPHVKRPRIINPRFCGSIRDMRALVHINKYRQTSSYITLKTVFPGWDNTARKPDQAFIFHHAEPEVYKTWLKNALRYTQNHNPPHAHYVFINAWNEWAEGAHLEPDRKYGYAFLQATAEALEEFTPGPEDDRLELLSSPTTRFAENRF